jgi:hypothetical protein
MSGTILAIVEGQSEEEAIPLLLRRMLVRLDRPDVQVARPFRVKRTKVVRPNELERAVIQGSRDRIGVSAVLVILDADDDEPLPLEAALLARCREATPLPAAVVVAQRELEAWFLGCKDAFRGFRGIRANANAPANPEDIRGAKERLSNNMEEGQRYLEVAHQPAFADRMDLELTLQRCASFRRLEAALREILSIP